MRGVSDDASGRKEIVFVDEGVVVKRCKERVVRESAIRSDGPAQNCVCGQSTTANRHA